MATSFAQSKFNNQRVFVRVDFNVPLDEQFKVTDNNRIIAALPTIKELLQQNATVILASHLGRPKGTVDTKFSMKHVLPSLQQLLPSTTIHLAQDCIGEHTQALCHQAQAGEIVLLENLRFHKEEELGNTTFAKSLASLADCYINDAFGTAHRAHASTSVMAQYFSTDSKGFGLLMENEIANARKVMHQAEAPFCAILGGAKVSDKILIIENLLPRAQHIIIGGGMAYTFFKALGFEIGDSIVELDLQQNALDILEKAKQQNCQIHLPLDLLIADKFDNNANTQINESLNIPTTWQGLDCGPKSIAAFKKIIAQSKTILWNGPMGVFEMETFKKGTIAIAEAVSEATTKGSFSLIGGGDSVAAIKQFGFADKVSYISTGGGALLEFFEGKELPGISAIEQ